MLKLRRKPAAHSEFVLDRVAIKLVMNGSRRKQTLTVKLVRTTRAHWAMPQLG